MSSEVATQLEQDAIKRMYERLIAARDKSRTYDDSIIRDIEGSRMFQDAFCCADPIYKEQIAAIVATKPDVVIDDTVGEYLYGCFQPELAVEIACTPACADGLKNPDLTPCDIASYEKKDKLTKLNNIVSEDANVFVASSKSITNEDKKILRDQGVKVITIYDQDGNTINYVLGESIDITQEEPAPPPTQQTNSTTNWAWAWLILAIIVIVIIVVIIFFVRW